MSSQTMEQIETPKMNYHKPFEVLTITDDDGDDDNDSVNQLKQTASSVVNFKWMFLLKIGKKGRIMILPIKNYDNNMLYKKGDRQRDHSQQENNNIHIPLKENINVQQKNRLNENKELSTYISAARNKRKSLVLFTDSILKTLYIGEVNRYVKDGKFHQKSFPRSKTKQLNHHTIPILEEHQYDVAAIHIGTNDLIKRTSM